MIGDEKWRSHIGMPLNDVSSWEDEDEDENDRTKSKCVSDGLPGLHPASVPAVPDQLS